MRKFFNIGFAVVSLMAFSPSYSIAETVEKDSGVISDEMMLLRAESVMNRGNQGASIRAIKIDRETKELQIKGLVPIIIQVKYENVPEIKEPITTVMYASEDGEAFVPGVVNDKHGNVYGIDMVREQLAKYSNTVEPVDNSPKITQGNGLAIGGDGIELSSKPMNKESLDKPVVKKEELISFYKGNKVTPTSFWESNLGNAAWIKDGKDDAPVFYVFFDPWCSACHSFYKETRKLVEEGVVQLRWLGFGVMPNYPNHPAGDSSVNAAVKIFSANDKESAFHNYMEKNVLPDVAVNDSVMLKLQENLDLLRFSTNGGNPTPTVVMRNADGILGIRPGITAEGVRVVVNSPSYKAVK